MEQDFKEKILKKFGNNISFEKMVYNGADKKCILVCLKHNKELISTPSNFLRSKTCCCKECSKESNVYNAKNTEEFIKEAKLIHGDRYDYSKTKYINQKTKVIITCPIHGDFKQLPTNHLKPQDCPKCGRKKLSLNKCLTTEEFIKRSKILNGDKYDYSKTNYINAKTKVIITCSIHGDFEQNPDNHLRKHYGCPKCNESKGENSIDYYLRKNNIIFEREKVFLDDYGPKGWPLPYDFYLPEKNLLIEYQGEQHHKPTCYGGISLERAKENLKTRRHYDWLKRKYARDKKIGIMYINYTDLNNIGEIISKL